MSFVDGAQLNGNSRVFCLLSPQRRETRSACQHAIITLYVAHCSSNCSSSSLAVSKRESERECEIRETCFMLLFSVTHIIIFAACLRHFFFLLLRRQIFILLSVRDLDLGGEGKGTFKSPCCPQIRI